MKGRQSEAHSDPPPHHAKNHRVLGAPGPGCRPLCTILILLGATVSPPLVHPATPQSVRASKQLSHIHRTQAEQLRSTAEALAQRATREDLAQALKQLQESARLFQENRNNSDAALSYLRAGEIYATWGRDRQASAMYRLALQLAGKNGIDLKCSILSHLAVAYAGVSDLQRSLRFSNQAMALSKLASSLHARAEALVAHGRGLANHRPEEALQEFRAAADLFRSINDSDGQAQALLRTGYVLGNQSLLAESLASFNEAFRLWTAGKNLHGQALAQDGMGLMLVLTGRLQEAGEQLSAAQRTFHSIGDQGGEAVVLNIRGVISKEIGNYEDSLQHHMEAKTIFSRINDQLGEITSIDAAAEADWALHRYRRAQELFAVKLSLATQLHHDVFRALALLGLGDVAALQHHSDRARALYLRALNLFRKLQHGAEQGDVLIRLARLDSQQNQYARALAALGEVLQIKGSSERVFQRAWAYFEIAAVYHRVGRLDDARREVENALQMIESQRTRVSDFDDRASYFASVHEYYQLYIEILMQLHEKHPDLGFDQQAFAASEKSKVRSLLDMLAGAERNRYCDTQPGDCANFPSALTLPEAQAEIRGDHSVLLEYALGKEDSYIWVVDEERVASYQLPGSAQICRLAEGFHRDLVARQPRPNEDPAIAGERVWRANRDYQKNSQALAEALLGPVSHLPAGRRLIVVPDGCLQYIPFAALPFEDSKTLAGRFEVVSLPSVSTLKQLREAAARRPPPTAVAAIFADPVFASNDIRLRSPLTPQTQQPRHAELATQRDVRAAVRDVLGGSNIPRLPASRNEAQEVAGTMAGKGTLVAMDFDASRQAVLAGGLEQYRFIHIATHALLDTRHPELSGLVLSLVDKKGEPQDGYLRLKDIYQLKLSADMVVLSACNSALGKDLDSEGMIGLTRAFLYAGSKSVISSLWKVDDDATAELMRHFYLRIRDGERPGAALRGAQFDLSQNPEWGHAYYWAAFILQGEYR